MILALSLALMIQTQPASSSEFLPCVAEAADRLEASGEPVSVVAEAAISECRPKIRSWSQDSLLTREQHATVTQGLRDIAGENIRRRLVAVRACRNTAGCDVSTVAPAFRERQPRGQ